ncbi:cyclic-di-AMP receptor [Agrilactobacillus yilanensis]|uniref:Cyclic-di-AMP receptor n=1 Tax=Agrilactobacillus yilanensis TaxID=2485997 RepID=A0ABW4J8R4_9LACO|nr:cyclic-di-AMP receptor [Agrilactobacillus yilanensis]
MKLILAIVQDKDAGTLSNNLVDANVQATKLSTTGGFLKSGNTTFIIGIEDERVDDVLTIIKETSHAREQFMAPPVNIDVTGDSAMSYPIEVQIGGATVFVLPVDQFHHF